jgi:hypothetical protein
MDPATIALIGAILKQLISLGFSVKDVLGTFNLTADISDEEAIRRIDAAMASIPKPEEF